MALLIETVFLIGTIIGLFYYWCKYNYSYWKRHGINQVKPVPLIGNIGTFLMLKTNFGLHLSNIYLTKQYKDASVVGIYIFNKPAIIVRDIELVKNVLIKDFNKFSNRYAAADPHSDSLGSKNILVVKNPKWREMRTKITPVFTSGKIKQMYPLMLEIGDELEAHLASRMKGQPTYTTEIKEICALFTTDVIATIAFGIRVNSLRDPGTRFRVTLHNFFEFDLLRAKDFFVSFFVPHLVKTLRTKMFSMELTRYMRSTISHVIEEREKCGHMRNDLIDILVAMKKAQLKESQKTKLDMDENDLLVSIAAVFLVAGYETSSSTMSFALYELAKNMELQNRLREEILDGLIEGEGHVSYEKIQSMEYLDMVVNETLRLYPVLPFLDREYESIPGEGQFKLDEYPNYIIPEGLAFYIPIFAIQRDEKYWPNPNEFDPERFSAENKKNIQPMTYMPFGSGPRNCLGSRIGLLQTKLGLVHFLKNHYVAPAKNTVNEIQFNPKALTLQNTGGMYLNIIKDQMYSAR